jgi:hypothetical protein
MTCSFKRLTRQLASCVIVSCCGISTTTAQTIADSKAPTVSALFDVSYDALFADRSVRALGADAHPVEWGGGANVRWRGHLLVIGRLSRTMLKGSRAYVDGGTVFPLDVPVRITLTTFELTGAYQHRLRDWLDVLIGAGADWTVYDETSQFADGTENIHEWHPGAHVLGGVEFARWRRLRPGVIAEIQTIPDSLGHGGLTSEFNDHNLGHASIRLQLRIGR